MFLLWRWPLSSGNSKCVTSMRRSLIVILSSSEICMQWSKSDRDHQGDWGLEHMAYVDRLRELGQFSVRTRRQREDFVEVFSYLKGDYREHIAWLFSGGCCRKSNSRSPKLCWGKICLHRRKNEVTMRVVKHWNRLPRVVVGPLTLEMLKAHLDEALSNLFLLIFPWTGVRQDNPRRSLLNENVQWFWARTRSALCLRYFSFTVTTVFTANLCSDSVLILILCFNDKKACFGKF